MFALLSFVLAVLTSPFKSKSRLEAENAALRHQLIVLRRKVQGRVRLTNNDRRFLIQLYRWFPSILQVLAIVQPETLVRWHRAGFRRYWCWKSRSRGGRPQNRGGPPCADSADERHEQALDSNHVATTDELYRNDPRTIRYGQSENSRGYMEIGEFVA